MENRQSSNNYDYTEGASAIDISSAVTNSRRTRRDSQYSLPYDDGNGSMFDGPGHSAIPSSVSRMSTHRSLSRRRSEDSQGSRPPGRTRRGSETSATSQVTEDTGQDEEDIAGEAISMRRGRKSPSPHRSGVFGNIAQLFARDGGVEGKRRPSLSQRSTASSRHWARRSDAGSDVAVSDEEDGDDRWGYSSGEEDEPSEEEDVVFSASPRQSEMDFGSYPPSPSHSASLPLLSNDQFFGDETRIEIDLEPLDPPPPGPPSRQTIYLPDEDATVRFVGYEALRWRQWAWRAACILSAGILGLLGHWFPRLWLSWAAQERAFKDIRSGFVVVETTYRDIAVFPVHRLPYPYHTSTVFSGALAADALSTAKAMNGSTSIPDEHGDGEILETLLIVDYRYARYALDHRSGLFSMVRDWRDPSWTNVSSAKDGLDESVRQQRLTLFGLNLIDIEGKSTISLMVDEVIHPFYVFQIASIVLWSLDDYYYYAFCIALISTVSIATTLVETKKTIARMREMSRFSCPVSVFVDGIWLERDSSDLVPGDIINLIEPPLSLLPADLFLLSGDAIVNESMLTGESVPVSKIPVNSDDLARWRETRDILGDMAKSFLYAGTKVVRIRKAVETTETVLDRPALGMVARTGFNTTKGALVRSMLFPKPMGFKFYRDSIRFIMVLAGIAGLGFCASAVQFVRLGVRWHTILIRALDLITVVVPPALPATLSIGTSFALSRLRRSGIFCISPNRINVAGKINVCCFDKTGTLTEDGLDILGVRGLERTAHRFGELVDDVHDLPMGRDKAAFLYALATCHQLKVVDGEVIGDPLDVKMFQFTKWMIEEGHVAGTGLIRGRRSEGEARPAALVQTIVRPPGSAQFRVEDALKGGARHAHFLEFGVIRTFEFVSQLRRMSVVVKRLKSTSMEVYVKGAPEVMVDICDKSTFPDDYDDLLSYYTKRGYRVIAIAGKSIEGLTWLKAQRMKRREQAESGLNFLGLIIFENKLKPGTAPAIQALRSAHLACRMITGDNPLTAVSVAQECNLISQTAHVFAPAFVRGNASTPMAKLEWTCMEDTEWELDDYSLKPLTPPPHHSVDADMLDYQDYALVITGDVFRWMINNAPLETLQRMLAKTQIFARMSPDEKNEVVERLQGLGYTVLMCGDGANDCAALKAADVGLSLSEAEASVAAPFTSKTPDIGCVIEVIKEGRAALVTSFSCFKYMALYSLIQFTTITLLYSFASSLGDFQQFLYIDLFIIIPVAVTMGRTLPFPRIHPKRPTASLVSKAVLASIIGQIIITSAAQFWAFFWVRRQPWYEPTNPKNDDEDDHLQANNYENSVLFLLSCFQYILVAAVFSIGAPYRKPMWTNGWLMLSLSALSTFNILVLLAPPRVVSDILELMPLPLSARVTLLCVGVINVALSLAFERWGAQVVADAVNAIGVFQQGPRRRVRDGKAYRAVEVR
ncbi:P-type ATPase [Auriscalpium vulgare]|uniref:P-type ATPase n=1 Tax=Auriscalpium vulgare TaxID=40419 RepID=A0ACB8S3Y8_9AGAM|nr:P-type ATPase [Auriscalpium vulgare]